MMINKSWPLTKSLTLTLAPPNQRGICFKCSQEKVISVISERKPASFTCEERKFCQSCSLTNLYELEQSKYEIANKTEIIKEIKEVLEQKTEQIELW